MVIIATSEMFKATDSEPAGAMQSVVHELQSLGIGTPDALLIRY